MFPILGSPITNFAPEGEDGTLYFNYSDTDGKRFNTDESVLAKFTFKVIAEGNGTIDTEIRTMAKTDEAVTKIVYNSERLEEFYYVQTLEGNTQQETTPVETTPVETQPDGLFVKADGVLYEVEQGQTYNYTAYLTVAGAKVGSIDASTYLSLIHI